jgi:hypothetical protein
MSVETLAPTFLRDMVICLDDFERTEMKTEEVLGLISELKEERNCKVALVFNQSKLGHKESAYRAYKEKVVDYEISYAPTVDEAIDLVFRPNFARRTRLVEHVRELDIRNIRILRKVRDALERVAPLAAEKHEEVGNQILASTVLLCWCAYAPEAGGPKIEEISHWNATLMTFRPEQQEPATLAWVQRLQRYGFTSVDELDLALARVIERGYVTDTGLEAQIAKADEAWRHRGQADELGAAWNRFHGTLVDDPEDFIATFYAVSRRTAALQRPAELNSGVALLRQLGRHDLADDLIGHFVDVHKETPDVFDLSRNDFADLITDSSLREAFEAAHAAHRRLPSLEDSLLFMSTNSGYNPEHLAALHAATVDDYERVFRTFSGTDLRNAIKWSLRWKDTENAAIGQRAREALIRLKNLSALNALRLSKFGV